MGIEEEYKSIIDDYNDFLKEVTRTIEKQLLKKNIPIAFEISSRIKELNSIQEKHSSKRFIIKETITELNDLVGLRIVLLFADYKEEVIKLLLELFRPIKDFDHSLQNTDKFGYSSVHLILAIKDEWSIIPDWKEHINKKVEIQIRTLSEHIWAETSHKLFYKREENIPKIINRDLYRLAALLEVVDEKIQNIKYRVNDHFQQILVCSYEEILKMDLNPETFRRVLLNNSDGLYKFDDYKNRELSYTIEHNYNINNTLLLDVIIRDKIDFTNCNEEEYVTNVIELLEIDKLKSIEKANFEK